MKKIVLALTLLGAAALLIPTAATVSSDPIPICPPFCEPPPPIPPAR